MTTLRLILLRNDDMLGFLAALAVVEHLRTSGTLRAPGQTPTATRERRSAERALGRRR